MHSMEGAAAKARSPTPSGAPRSVRRRRRRRRAAARRLPRRARARPDAPLSRHLGSRLAVESALLDAVPEGIALRASIVIGARSRSFRFLVRLIERMPVMALPAWRENRTAPIDGRDVLDYLARAATAPAELAGRSWDIGGPDVMTYAAMIARIADALMVRRPSARSTSSLTPIASVVAAAIAGEDPALIEPLMESLEHDLLPRDDDAAAAFGVRLHGFDAAVERALRDWERDRGARRAMTAVNASIEIARPPERGLGRDHGSRPLRRLGDDPPQARARRRRPAARGLPGRADALPAPRELQGEVVAGRGRRAAPRGLGGQGAGRLARPHRRPAHAARRRRAHALRLPQRVLEPRRVRRPDGQPRARRGRGRARGGALAGSGSRRSSSAEPNEPAPGDGAP